MHQAANGQWEMDAKFRPMSPGRQPANRQVPHGAGAFGDHGAGIWVGAPVRINPRGCLPTDGGGASMADSATGAPGNANGADAAFSLDVQWDGAEMPAAIRAMG